MLGFLGLNYRYPLNLTRLNQKSTVVLDEKDQLLTVLLSEDGYWRLPVSLSSIEPNTIRMLIAFEDKRYYYHFGIDPLAMMRALWQWHNAGHVVSGGSTLTLQVARLLEPRARTLLNKLKESFRALQLELHFSKRELLEMYLTLAPYGGNLEGIRAASLSFFGKEPKHLTPAESALLIAIPQKPNDLRPDLHSKAAKEHRDKVILRMQSMGILNKQEVTECLEDAIPKLRRYFPRYAPHLAYALRSNKNRQNQVKNKQKQNQSQRENQKEWVSTVTINPIFHTTLNLAYQLQIENYLKQELPFLEPTQTISAIVVDNKTREIKAYVGSADFLNDQRLGQIDMNRAIRSPGSTLKPFIYALGFDDGIIHPETLIYDIPTAFGQYAPNNLRDTFHGAITIREALQQSLNVPAVALLDKIGPGRFTAHLKNFNVKLKFEHEQVNPSLPLALGGVGMYMYDLMGLYTALANNGQFRPLTFQKEELQEKFNIANAKKSKKHPDDKSQVELMPDKMLMQPHSSRYITHILEEAAAPDGFVDNRAIQRASIAFKTGTSFGYRDAWAIGYTEDFTIGIWIGKPDGTPSLNQLGRTHALPILFKIFNLLPNHCKTAKTAQTVLQQNDLSAPAVDIPAGLREFRVKPKVAKKTVHSTLAGSNAGEAMLKISFPKEGSTIHLECVGQVIAEENALKWQAIPIYFVGGHPPFYLFENGEVLASPTLSRSIHWKPKTTGFVELTILDSSGHSDTVNLNLLN